MSKQHRLLLTLGAAAGGLVAAAVVPMAVANADDCSAGDCTLVSGGSPTDVVYEGFRPFFTDWASNQPTNVVVTDAANPAGAVSGSYSVSEQDYQTPLFDDSAYHYGNFTQTAAEAAAFPGTDSLGLSGASIYDFTVGPGSNTVGGEATYFLNQLNIDYANGTDYAVTTVPGSFTNVLESTWNGSADFVQMSGQSGFTLLWDSLPSASVPVVPDVLPPDTWFPDLSSAYPPDLL